MVRCRLSMITLNEANLQSLDLPDAAVVTAAVKLGKWHCWSNTTLLQSLCVNIRKAWPRSCQWQCDNEKLGNHYWFLSALIRIKVDVDVESEEKGGLQRGSTRLS